MRVSQLKIVAFLVGISTLLLVFVALAQDDGLLTNGGFEEPYLTLDGEPLREVPDGWTPWHVDGQGSPRWRNRQPAYLMVSEGDDLVREGEAAQLLASYYETHDAGLYQVIDDGIAAGMHLEFSAYARVWSNATEDRAQSEYDGDVFVQVGIDPDGGRDPASENIVWSMLTERYDEYVRHVVKAVAVEDKVTVFLRSWVLKPQAYSQVHWDEAQLRVLNAGRPNPDVTIIAGVKTYRTTATPAPDG